MNSVIHMAELAKVRFLGTRFSARPLRQELENTLADHREVTIDFKGMSVTQSFIDEFLGVLVLRHGPDYLHRLIFKGCSDDVKEIISFVLRSRVVDHIEAGKH